MGTDFEHLGTIRDMALANPHRVEPTFRCPDCCDTQFITRVDSRGRVYGRRCRCLLEQIENKPKSILEFKARGRECQIEPDEGIPF